MQEAASKRPERRRDRVKRGIRSAFRTTTSTAKTTAQPGPIDACRKFVPSPSTTECAVPTSSLTTQLHSLRFSDDVVASPVPQVQSDDVVAPVVGQVQSNYVQAPPFGQTHSHHAAHDTDLWIIAQQSRSDDERAAINATKSSGSDIDTLEGLSEDLRQKRDQCEKNKLRFEFRGQQIIIRDVVEKALVWISKFKEIGDIVVQYDPTVTAGSEQMAALLIGVEKVSSMISRCKIYESMYLEVQSPTQSSENLKSALVDAYTIIQDYLVTAHRLYDKSATTRTFYAMLNPDKITKFVNDCNAQEGVIEAAARFCENIYTREANRETANRSENLRQLLLTFNKPLSRLDSRVGAMFAQLENSKQSKILQWISPIPYQDSHVSAREGRTKETGRWLLQHPRFRKWRTSSSSTILWLHGSPGTGKTKLVSTVVDDLLNGLSNNPNDEALAYFYCDRNRTEYQTPTSILSSLTRQVSLSRDAQSVQKSTVQFYDEKHKAGFASNQLSLEESQTLLRKLTETYPQTTLVLDALDECDKSTRLRLVHFLNELLEGSPRLLKIFISSRPDVDLRIEYESGPNLEIQAAYNQEDIRKFVEDTITNNESPPYWRKGISNELRQRVCATLGRSSEGMFQWVALQIRQLHSLSRERDIETRLAKLPRNLEEAYNEIYDRIQSAEGSASDVANKAFQWLMCSEKAMSPAMLVAAVCQDPITDIVDVVDIDFDFILNSCQNLLKVEGPRRKQVCRFSHLSVQEYLEKIHWSQTQTNCLVAQVCLVILNDPIQQTLSLNTAQIDDHRSRNFKDISEAEPFSHVHSGIRQVNKYARYHWMSHVQRSGQVEGDFDIRLITLLKNFIGSPTETFPAYRNWFLAALPERRSSHFPSMETRNLVLADLEALEPSSLPSLPIAFFGLHRMLREWWDSVDPRQENAKGQPLLLVAVMGGCASTVQELLVKGADIEAAKGGIENSALYEVSSRGDESVTRVLLENGADVNARGGPFMNALQVASSSGHESIVQLLLEKGADMSAQGPRFSNALEAATLPGYKHIVEMLLARGADVNAQGGQYGHVLQLASSMGFKSMVELLLANGANVNAQGGKFGNALRAAFIAGQESIVKILLAKGASVAGHGPVVELLLAMEPNVNAQGGEYGNVLQAASFIGSKTLVELILAKGANVNAQGGKFGSALQAASWNGNEQVVELLLAKGADVNAEGGKYGNALQCAKMWARESIVTILLDHGALHRDSKTQKESLQSQPGSMAEMPIQESAIGLSGVVTAWGESNREHMKTHDLVNTRMPLHTSTVHADGRTLRETASEYYGSVAARKEKTANFDKALVAACKPCTAAGSQRNAQDDVKTLMKLLLNADQIDPKGHARLEAMKNKFEKARTLLRKAESTEDMVNAAYKSGESTLQKTAPFRSEP